VARPKNGHKTSAKDSTESKSRKRPIEQHDHAAQNRKPDPSEELLLNSVTI
jgi:hypothetical protein